MKILVTGSNGQLGSEIRSLFLNNTLNHEWIFTDIENLDLNDLKNIENKLHIFSPNIIINCAAYTLVDQAETDKLVSNNINNLAVGLISRWSNKNKCKLIHISTDYVYSGNSKKPLLENSKANPINNYGKTKLNGEKECLIHNPKSIIIRTSWLYSSFGNNFVKKIIELSKIKKEIYVVNDQYGSPTYAGDLARVIAIIIKKNNWTPGIYNYSNEGELSWYDLAVDIKNILKLDIKIKPVSSDYYKTIAKRPKFSLMDKTKIKETFNLVIPNYYDSLVRCLLIINNEK